MKRFTGTLGRILLLALVAFLMGALLPGAHGQETEIALQERDAKAIEARIEQLKKDAPEGATLVSYLDCGTELSSSFGTAKITVLGGKTYTFAPAQDAGPLPEGTSILQQTIFFAESNIDLKVSGVDRTKRYQVHLTWWDFDAGGRTQSVICKQSRGYMLSVPVAAQSLPNFAVSGDGPAEKSFRLPVHFADAEGNIDLKIRKEFGPNAVVSELWIYEVK